MAETPDAVTGPSDAWYLTHRNTHVDGDLQVGFRLTKDQWSEAKLDIEKHAAGIKQGKNYKGNKVTVIRQDAHKLVTLVPALGSAPRDWLVSVTAHLITSAISRVGRRQNKPTDQLSSAPAAKTSHDTTSGASASNPDGGGYSSPSPERTASSGSQMCTEAASFPIEEMYLSVQHLRGDSVSGIDVSDIVDNEGVVVREKLNGLLAGKRFKVLTLDGKESELDGIAFITNQIRQHAAARKQKVLLIEY